MWNNLNVTIQKAWVEKCDLEVKIVQSSTDKLTNRYLAWKEIETDCEYIRLHHTYLLAYLWFYTGVFLADEQLPEFYSFLVAYETWQAS